MASQKKTNESKVRKKDEVFPRVPTHDKKRDDDKKIIIHVVRSSAEWGWGDLLFLLRSMNRECTRTSK